jgi:WD40 repeat protein
MSAWWSLARHAVRTGIRAAWPLRTLSGHAGGVAALDISADGQTLVTAGYDGTVRQWDIGSGACVRVLKGHQGTVKSVCLSADGRLALSGSQDGVVRLWRLDTGECLRVLIQTSTQWRDQYRCGSPPTGSGRWSAAVTAGSGSGICAPVVRPGRWRATAVTSPPSGPATTAGSPRPLDPIRCDCGI